MWIVISNLPNLKTKIVLMVLFRFQFVYFLLEAGLLVQDGVFNTNLKVLTVQVVTDIS